jgi:prevent-host-death family protein
MERVKVGIRELRLNLSRYVARAKNGTEVVVTERGQPVARLVQIGDDEDDAVFDRLVREGIITPALRPKRKTLPPPVKLEGDGPLVSEMVLEDRH